MGVVPDGFSLVAASGRSFPVNSGGTEGGTNERSDEVSGDNCLQVAMKN